MTIDMSMKKAMVGSRKRGRSEQRAVSQQRGGSTQARETRAEMAEGLALEVRPTAGEGALGELPDALVGVELGGA